MNSQFSEKLLTWFDRYGRHNLPWQRQPTPYHVWLSEIMLQQTQVETVIPYYHRFLKRFPTVESLADANIDDVLSYWAGLGYYARGRNLHRAAKIIVDNFGGELPQDKAQLLTLPGVGRSTAGAIMALAFKQPYAILDGNVKRVLCRFYAVDGYPGGAAVEKRLWRLAEDLTPKNDVARYTQAMMDMGATICTRSNFKCDICPIAEKCLARKQGTQHKYPTPKPKKIISLRKIVFILLKNEQGEMLFQKRPQTGIWGGLWSFPECSSDDDVEKWLLTTAGTSGDIIGKLPTIRHTLTHVRMDILPIYLKAEQCKSTKEMDEHRWSIPEDALRLAIPSPVRNLLLTMTE